MLVQRAWDLGQRELLLENRPRLLVPLDGSAFAESVLEVAARLAEDLGAELVLLRVETTPWDVLTAEKDVHGILPAASAEEYLVDVSRSLVERWPDLTLSTLVRFGEPDAGIAAAAAETSAALVIMATHGRTGLRRATLGSVAGRVLEHGYTPLVLTRPPRVPAESAG